MIAILASYSTNIIRLYLDGVFAAIAMDSFAIVKVQHQLQAVQVEDSSRKFVGFMASSSNGFRTDKSWRCTDVYRDGWFLPSYNDTSWPTAHAVTIFTYFIAPDAKWIGYAFPRKRIFCRRTKGKKTF